MSARLAVLFFALQAADLGTTLIVLSRRGGYEANPVVAAILALGFSPLAGLMIAKAVTFVLMALAMRFRPRALAKVIVYYACVVTWNLFLILIGGLSR